MRGRISILTPELGALVLESLRSGVYFKTACEYAGIHVSTGHQWMQKGREHVCTKPVTPSPTGRGRNRKPREVVVIPECADEHEHIYVDFVDAVSRVDAGVERDVVEGILRSSVVDWRAGAFFLERRHSDHWRKREEAKVVGPDGGPVVFEFRVVRDNEQTRAVPGQVQEVA